MSSRMDERVHGFVLKTQDMGEADVLVTWFTLELGKVRGVITGGRRLTSRLGAGARYGVITELRLVARNDHGLFKLAGARSLLSVPELEDERSVLLQWFLEVILRALPDAEKNEQMFALAESFFVRLAKLDKKVEWGQFLLVILKQILQALGVAVRVTTDEPRYFSVSGGGFFEHSEHADRQVVLPGLYNRYLGLQDLRVQVYEPMGATLELDRVLLVWLHTFLEYYLERKIRSFAFINGIMFSSQ